MKKRLLLAINLILVLIISFVLIIVFRDKRVDRIGNLEDNDRVIIVSLFPEYDFTKQIVKDKFDVRLIMDSGVETHNFEPTAKDIISINNADLFICLGQDLEPWVDTISNSITNKNKIVNCTKDIELLKMDEFEEEKEEEHHDHEHSLDEHIWLSLKNSEKMINNILEEIIRIDKENEAFYRKNAEEYINQIKELDKSFQKEFENKDLVLAFGGEFAYAYFIKEYDLKYISVFDNCGEGEDPSIYKVKSVIDVINNKNIKYVFYEELSEGLVAKMIAEETKAEARVMYSIHNGDINKDTYVSLMNKNLENIRLLNSK